MNTAFTSSPKHLPRKFNDVSEWVSRYQSPWPLNVPSRGQQECTVADYPIKIVTETYLWTEYDIL